jgi:hypothetical protein
MTALNYTETLTVVHCTCGIAFAIPGALYQQMQGRKKSVYCPLGHQWHYAESLEEKLSRERREHQATRELLLAEERSHSATRGVATKLRKKVERAEHGVCPHCKRSFQNLRRHMESKHTHAG